MKLDQKYMLEFRVILKKFDELFHKYVKYKEIKFNLSINSK